MAKSDIRRIADEVIEKLKAMSQEEFERDVLKLNGTMSDELFEKVMKEVYRLQTLDEEGLLYEVVDTEVTAKEFSEVFYYIKEYAKSRGIVEDYNEESFPEYRLHFRYRGGDFIWRMLIGQGTALQIHAQSYDDWPEVNPLKFDGSKAFEMLEVDRKIKYYKPDVE